MKGSIVNATTQKKWLRKYNARSAHWCHSGKMTDPHVTLASGMHSDRFLNSRIVTPDRRFIAAAARDLVSFYVEAVLSLHVVDMVVGPATGGTVLAELLSKEIGKLRHKSCLWASPARLDWMKVGAMHFSPKQQMLFSGYPKMTLLCEDVITTGGSVEEAVTATRAVGGIPLDYVLALVNRSGESVVNGRTIISLIDLDIPVWKPEGCTLCAAGSEAILPKGDEGRNWLRLTGKL